MRSAKPNSVYYFFKMQSWLIILIVVLSGLAVFVILFALKNRKGAKNLAMQQPVVMVTSASTIPSTNNQPTFNMGTPPTMYQYAQYPPANNGQRYVQPGYGGHPHLQPHQGHPQMQPIQGHPHMQPYPNQHGQIINPTTDVAHKMHASPGFMM